MLKRIHYVSMVLVPPTDEVVEAILESSYRHNRSNDVTGVLLATPTNYFQVFEGPTAAVDSTFCRIVSDERHGRIQLLSSGPASERLYEGWLMRRIDPDGMTVHGVPLASLIEEAAVASQRNEALSASLQRAIFDFFSTLKVP